MLRLLRVRVVAGHIAGGIDADCQSPLVAGSARARCVELSDGAVRSSNDAMMYAVRIGVSANNFSRSIDAEGCGALKRIGRGTRAGRIEGDHAWCAGVGMQALRRAAKQEHEDGSQP